MKKILLLVVVVGIVSGGAWYYHECVSAGATTSYRTAKVRRGDVAPTISATGTLQPEDIINVGAQVAGLITGFGKDIDGKLFDYNSVVEKDMVLAYIDQAPYKAALDQATATLEKSRADLMQYEAKLFQTEQELKRAESLRPSKAIADTDYDLSVSNYKVAIANVKVAKAVIKQNQAALDVAKTNFGYTVIKSPVRGTVIDRRVNIGQTVVASLNAPSVCLIAKDLRRLQVWALVSEANMGRVFKDMPVEFTVQAHSNRVFHGKVIQIRMNAQMTSSVVNYFVIVEADNSDGKLLPYMTATVRFQEPKRTNVLVVPNAALRWKPKSGEAAAAAGKKNAHFLWVETDDGDVAPIEVKTGPTDGTVTEVRGDGVHEGMRVVIGTGGGGSEDESSSSMPFMPKFPKRGPPKGGGGPPPG